MLIEKRIPGGMDGDTDPRQLDDKSWLNVMNCRSGVTEFGRNFRFENIPGTTPIPQSVRPIYGFSKTIGSVLDEENNRFIDFLWNSHGDHSIFCTYILTGITYGVLYDSQVDTGLNFSRDSLIHSAKVVNGILIWPDSTNNQPRSLNIDAAIKANNPSFVTDAVPYILPLDFSELTLIKAPPIFGANIQKATDLTFVNNFIANDSFQFSFQYEFYTREVTVVGTYSASSRLNKPADTFNYMAVTMDVNEFIPNSVRFVNLIVRVGNTAKTVKTWDKEVSSEATEIASQNAGSGVLTYNFYNNVTGQPLAPNLILKPYDSVPDYAQAYEVAKNRGFFGNIITGHDTPETTSLSFSLVSTAITGSNLVKNLIGVRLTWLLPLPVKVYSGWYVFLTGSEASPSGYYSINSTESTSTTTLPPAPTTVAFSGLTFRGTNQSDVVEYARILVGASGDVDINIFNFTSTPVTITGISISTFDVFKNKSQYKLCVQFFDFAMRYIGGAITNDDLVVPIPARNYSYSTATTGIVWALSNTNALIEIPDNAYYYAIGMTLNLKLRFFIESFDDAVKYATRDNNGLFTFTSTTFVTGAVGIGINTSALIKSGLGYTFQEGDIAILYQDNGNTYELPVLGVFGNYIVVKSNDIGDVSGARFIYEIYTPYKTSDQEPFYFRGETYKILNPTEPTRQYSTLSDTFAPDCYAISRNYNSVTYFAEAMSANDLFYNRWDTDDGKFTLVTKLGRQVKPYSGCFSNVYIPGTATNGLNSFEAINIFTVPKEGGSITKLILADKIQDKGDVMLALCSNNPSSIYIGEVQVADSTGLTKYFAISEGVIGTINPLKEGGACINAESAISYFGLVFWADAVNGEIRQYSTNGSVPISRYNQTRFFKRYFQNYAIASTNNLKNINGFSHIRLSIDPFHKELIVSLPGLIYENYANVLPSYTSVPSYATSIIERFDIYDGLQKCMAFSFEKNIWGSNFVYGCEWFDFAGSIMYGWKDGNMWTFNTNTTNWNTFFGIQQPIRLCVTGNLNPSALKDLMNVALESNVIPDFSVAMANFPNEQISDLTADDYTDDGGIYYATWLMDRLSPNQNGTADQKLYTGDPLTDFALFFMFEFQQYDNLIYINFVNIGYDVSKGNKQILNTVNT